MTNPLPVVRRFERTLDSAFTPTGTPHFRGFFDGVYVESRPSGGGTLRLHLETGGGTSYIDLHEVTFVRLDEPVDRCWLEADADAGETVSLIFSQGVTIVPPPNAGAVTVSEPVSVDDNGGSLTVDDGGTPLEVKGTGGTGAQVAGSTGTGAAAALSAQACRWARVVNSDSTNPLYVSLGAGAAAAIQALELAAGESVEIPVSNLDDVFLWGNGVDVNYVVQYVT